MQHDSVSLFGSQVHYWTKNPEQQQTIVIIHGYRGTHDGLEYVMDGLPGYRLVAPDLPGFGDSTSMTERPHTIEGYADLIIALIHHLGLKKVIILGHSMGTVIGADVVKLEPDLVSHLVIINPVAEHPLKGSGAIRMAPGVWYQWAAAHAPEGLGMRLLKSKLFLLIGSAAMTKTKDKALRRKIHNIHLTYMIRFSDRKTLLEVYQSSLSGNVTSRVPHINVPTLIIAGRIDAIAPIAGQRKLALALKDSTLVELPNVGHIIHYEQPKEAAAAIVQFLRQRAPAA
jgi:pimeloyl-ACP methyl ester carboxylesterase